MDSTKDLQRILSKLERQDECIIWTEYTNSGGYGMTRAEGKTVLVHRFIYTIYNGPIPDGLLVRHTCDNPPCCNPEHLVIGTHQDNSDDKYSRNRQIHLPGERNGRSVLTSRDTEIIREMYSTGNYLQKDLAELFGVHQTNISSIVRKSSWSSSSSG